MQSITKFVVACWVLCTQFHANRVTAATCSGNQDCERLLLKGSECVNGQCTNPFYSGGCLSKMLPGGWNKTRACGSDDPPLSAIMGHCKPSTLDYMEIRILSQSWLAANVLTWLIQILLSELLDVPVSVETGVPGLSTDFYNVNSTLGVGTPHDWGALTRSAGVGDCLKLSRNETCAHVMPGIIEDALGDYSHLLKSQAIEQPVELGLFFKEGWFIPRFTAYKDPTLVSYAGMMGEKNRRKLAETFLRPTTWRDYCNQVSNSSCRTPNGVAARAPVDAFEQESYFMEGLYTGHFRATEQNNCDKYPTNCTGHMVDLPCGWPAFTHQQTYHLGIALESNGGEPSGGYTPWQLSQIWDAANATKSNVLSIQATNEFAYHAYLGTDAEYTVVSLPPHTQACLDARVNPMLRCNKSTNLTVLRGDPKGACDYAPQMIQKVIGGKLQKVLHNPGIQEGLWSPAYQALKNFKITEAQLGVIFRYIQQRKVDPNFDPREATCRWIVEHIDLVKSFMPDSYPRIVMPTDFSNSPLFGEAVAAMSIAFVLLICCSVGTYVKRKNRSIYRLQLPLLCLVLFGLLFVLVGSSLLIVGATDATCISYTWLTNIGYGIALVPLFVRVNAIHRLLGSGKQMQRVRLTTGNLLRSVGTVCLLLAAFLVVRTVVDDQHVSVRYLLTQSLLSTGETVVHSKSYCSSGSNTWAILGVTWQSLLSLVSLLQAIMASRVQDDLNESKQMAALLLSIFMFSMLRFTTVFLADSLDPFLYIGALSLFYSVDCIGVLSILLIPKLLTKDKSQENSDAGPDLFIGTTIIFVEVTGFAAWSSVRDPGQVFRFLEVVYGAFDDLAEQRKVFKVETVGDCYVAASGIPHARSDHAVLMARFAMDCLRKMRIVAHEQGLVFGPDTANLSLKIGMHSGPVTGGFLKGKGARFQLFGDTMITTGQVTQAGEAGRIHISEEVANLLVKDGKERWIKKRETKVATSNGEIQTYWLIGTSVKALGDSGDISLSNDETGHFAEDNLWHISHDSNANHKQRLIDWNVELLHGLLRQIVARRNPGDKFKKQTTYAEMSESTISSMLCDDVEASLHERHQMPLDEVKEIIMLPEYDRRASRKHKDPESIVLPSKVLDQLKYYVTTLAEMYRDNPFHNFDHASHVVMATIKHMNRITAPKDALGDEGYFDNNQKVSAALHDHTYGITSDPLTQFACVFSALIHDLDHPGVPNGQLIKEDKKLSTAYYNRSVAEQNSFDLAWNLLMGEEFKDLCATICGSKTELTRFRQLVINSVMATDLGDKELKALRNGRWAKAFSINEEELSGSSDQRDAINRKATIVIEHLIQASDVSHTMQHWEVYREWNEKLFREMYSAYRNGRAEQNPADTWYEGEIGFFDYYIIPLSQKLRDCGVFGVSSDENYNYAKRNRDEWVSKGQNVVAEMLAKAKEQMDKELGDTSDAKE